jgi:uncharacterized protein (DUF1330 family)
MAAYVIVETEITDPEGYERYKAASPGTIAAAGGRYLARGGELDVLEGDWRPSRLVVLEFEDLAAARRWYDSEPYREARRLRDGAARMGMVAVQGVEEPPGA